MALGFRKMPQMEKSVSENETELIAIAKNAGLGIGGRLFFLSVRFCTVLLVTRTIGPEQYGIFVLTVSIIAIVGALSLMGLQPAMVKFVAQYKAKRNISLVKGVIAFGLKVSLVSSAILVIGMLLSAKVWTNEVFHKIELTPVLRVMLLGVPFASLMAVLLSALQGAKLVKYRILVQQVLMPIFRLVAIAAAFLLGYRIMGVAGAWVLTAIFGFIVAATFLTKKIGFLYKGPMRVDRRTILSFSLPLLFSQLFYQNINVIGILIIGAFLPADQAGIYGVAMRVIPFILIPLFSYNAIFSPIISDLFTTGKMEELASVYKTGSKWVITITLPLFSLMVFFSREIASVFGSGFAQSAQIIIILLIAQMVNAASGSTGFMLSMTGKSLYNLFNSAALCAVNIVLALLLVTPFGVVGVACAYSVSIVLIQLLQMGEVWCLYKIHPYRLDHLKPVLSCLFSFVVIHFLRSSVTVSNHILSIMTMVPLFLFSYVSVLVLAGFSSDERMILEKIRHKISSKSAMA